MSVKISELPILDSLADNDIVAGVDVSGNVTSKIEMATLKNYIDTNTQYTAGTNIDITNNVVSAPNVYNKTETDELLEEKDEQIEELQSEIDSLNMIYNAFPTESGEGESLTLDDTAEVKFKKFDLKGNTSQTTYSGKNLLNACEHLYGASNGIKTTYNNEEYSINGTASASWAYIANNVSTSLTSGTYTLSITKTLPFRIYVTLKASDNSTFTIAINSGDTYGTVNISKDIVSYELSCANMTSGTAYNQTLGIQLEKNSSKTDYEPYTGGTASPNPSYPQPVNVVSGDNEINVVGKNLLQLANDKETFNYQNTHTIEDNTYIGIPTANWAQTRYKFYLEKNTQYTFSSKLTLEGSNFPNKWQVTIKNDDDTNIFSGLVDIIDNKISVSFNSGDNEYNEISFWSRTNDSSRDITKTTYSDIQLEKGSSVSEYEPYQGNTYNIDLPVENLLPISSLASTTSNGITFTNNNDGTYTLNGTATAEATFYIFGGNTEIKANSKLTFSCKELIGGTRIFWYDNWATISGAEQRIGSGKPNYTTTNEITTISQLRVNVSVVSGTTVNNLTIKPMLQKGTKANSYTPYGTTPIELCKIGNYQDYIYKDSGKWYLYKEIGKAVFNGSETWYKSTSYPGNYYSQNAVPNGITHDINCFSNLTSVFWAYLGQLVSDDNGIMLEGGSDLKTIDFKISSISTLDDFKSFLGNTNLILYYVYATPTNTEITYQPLIDQLNLLEQAQSKENQTNISQVSNDKPFILDVTAIKSLQNVLDRIELLES